MNNTAKEVLEFVQENDIQFIRLAFCDLFGCQKNVAIMSDGLSAAFENGVSFDAHSIKGFSDVIDSDLMLFPDPATLCILPWRSGPGRIARFYCDIKRPDGSLFLSDGRALLKRVSERAERLGYVCKVGAECEFYLFKTDENGEPSQTTIDKGTYFDMSPLDKGENIRREICLTLAQMGINPEASHHEQGAGQNEIDFEFGCALETADNLQTFKSVVKAIAERNGLFASFMPKPLLGEAGSGLHVNLSLSQNGSNIFKSVESGEHCAAADSFIAGILSKAREISLFLNPIVNSYERLGKCEAPKFVSWSHHNRSQLIRIPAAKGEKVRMELRSPDPSVNPYLAFALIISAGLDGIEQKATLLAPVNVDLFNTSKEITDRLERLPDNLSEAIECAEKSQFIREILGDDLLTRFVKAKRQEVVDFQNASNKMEFYQKKYFPNL